MFQNPFIFLKPHNLAIFAEPLPPPFLPLHTGHRFDQIMREHITTFQKFKMLAHF